MNRLKSYCTWVTCESHRNAQHVPVNQLNVLELNVNQPCVLAPGSTNLPGRGVLAWAPGAIATHLFDLEGYTRGRFGRGEDLCCGAGLLIRQYSQPFYTGPSPHQLKRGAQTSTEQEGRLYFLITDTDPLQLPRAALLAFPPLSPSGCTAGDWF